MVRIEEISLLRERVRHCYEREGVNHFQQCRKVVKEYMDAIKPWNGMEY